MDIIDLLHDNKIGFFVVSMSMIANDAKDKDMEKYVESFLLQWPEVKNAIREEYRKQHVFRLPLADFHVPEVEKFSQPDIDLLFRTILKNMDDQLYDTLHFEELISFSQDMMILFDWSEDASFYENLLCNIGDAYDGMGWNDDRDKYYQRLLASGKNEYIAARYAFCLLSNLETEKAEEVLAPYKDSDDETIIDRLEWLEELKR